MSIGDRIRNRRLEAGITSAELAERSGVSRGYMSEIETGKAPKPSAVVLFRIAEVLDTTVGDLLDAPIRPVNRSIPIALDALKEEFNLTEKELQMFANIEFRGRRPSSEADWRYLIESVRRSLQ